MAVAATQNDNTSVIAALNSVGGTGKSGVAEAQDRFLKLLVTQLQNQDPLNPMENAELTMQLAQMSTVEGINNLNSSLSSLLEGYRASQTLQAASLVGHTVLAEGNVLTLKDAVAGGGAVLDGPADSVAVEIYNGSGRLMRTLDLGAQDAGIVRYGWDGLDASGAQLPDGYYQARVVATRAGGQVETTPLMLAGVSSVVLDGGDMLIDLGALGQVGLAQVRQIY